MLELDLGVVNFTHSKINKSLFERAIFETLKLLKFKSKVEVSLVLVGEKRIRDLNKHFRKKDKVTDVLSFSFFEEAVLDLKSDSYVNMGEIFICLSVAKKQAKKKSCSLKRELALLSAHGVIHLCGIDHERSEKESLKTDIIQEKVLNNLNK